MKKDRIYTEQQRLFLDALTPCKGNVRAAMDIAGFSSGTPERYVLDLLHEEIVEIANKLIAGNAIKAALGLSDVLDTPEALGNAHKINAAKEILDRSGLGKKSQDEVNVKVGGGLLILPAKQKSSFYDNLKDDTDETQGS